MRLCRGFAINEYRAIPKSQEAHHYKPQFYMLIFHHLMCLLGFIKIEATLSNGVSQTVLPYTQLMCDSPILNLYIFFPTKYQGRFELPKLVRGRL